MSRHVLRHTGAQPTTVKCPKCGDIIVYNGNFFCNSMSHFETSGNSVFIIPGTCDWALPYPVTRKRDRTVAEKLYQLGYTSVLD